MSRHLRKRFPPALVAILLFIPLAAAWLHGYDDRQKPDAAAKAAPPQELLPIPEAPPQDLLKFIAELQRRRPDARTRDELISQFARIHGTIVAAAEKVLKGEIDEEARQTALAAQLESLGLLMRLGDLQAVSQARELAGKLKDHKDPRLASLARQQLVMAQLHTATNEPAETPKLIAELKAYLTAGPLDEPHFAAAMTVAQTLESSGDYAAALESYQLLRTMFLKSGNAGMMEAADDLGKSAQHRLGVVGKPLDLSGTLLDGKPLDWTSYKGKVVLVDFWATWCGPCRAELPNIKANYERYHDRGFEVLGVSLDRDRIDIENFVKEQSLPWANLFSDDPQVNNALADRYGIQGIPALMLIGRNGKVITLKARGEDLGRQLEKLLGSDAAAVKK